MGKLIGMTVVLGLLSVFITQLCFAGDIEKLQPDMAYESEQPAVTGGESTTLKIRQKTGKNEVIVQIDKITKSPHSIVASGLEVSSQDKAKIKNAIGLFESVTLDGRTRLKGEALSSSQYAIDQAARRFIKDNKDMLSADELNLRLLRIQKVMDKAYVTYQQYYKDIPVYQAIIRLVITQEGKVPSCGSDYHKDINVCAVPDMAEEQALITAKVDSNFDETKDEAVSGGLLILPLKENGAYTYHLAYKLAVSKDNPPASWVYFIDAHTKEMLVRYNDIRYETISGKVTGLMFPKYCDEAAQRVPFGNENVNYIIRDNADSITYFMEGRTNVEGSYGLYLFDLGDGKHTLETSLEGCWVNVINMAAGNDASYSESVSVPVTAFVRNIDWGASGMVATQAEMNCFYHVNKMGNYVKNTLGFEMRAIRANVNKVDFAGAYFDPFSGKDIVFGDGGKYSKNFALFSDIIYHEYTHAVNRSIYSWFPCPSEFDGAIDITGSLNYEGESGAIDEALANYFACTINNDSVVGEGANGTYLEAWYELNNTEKYSSEDEHDDYFIIIGGGTMMDYMHYYGVVIGGVFWDLRKSLGKELADNLIHNARFGHPITFKEYLLAILIVDDDNGNLFDGTPHEKEIKAAFEKHGINFSALTDTTPPTGAITINNDREYANSVSVTLTLSAADNNQGSGVSKMKISNTNPADWYAIPAVAYSNSYFWTLITGNGTKTVYAKFIDAVGNESTVVSDSIVLDTSISAEILSDTSRPVIEGVVPYDGDERPDFIMIGASWSAYDPESGIAEYQYAIGTTKGGTDIVDWTSNGTSNFVDKVDLMLASGTYYFSVKAINGAGLTIIRYNPLYIQSNIFNIPLKKGYNFISLPMEPLDVRVESVIAPISGKWKQIKSRNESCTSSSGKMTGNLKEMRAGMGYSILMTEDAVLPIRGNKVNYEFPQLPDYWNWVGPTTLEAKPVTALIDTSKIAEIHTVKSGSSDTTSEANKLYYPADFTVFEPGKGYKIKIKDTTAPTITHTPIKTADRDKPITFTAAVTDSASGVKEVTLMWVITPARDAPQNLLPMTSKGNNKYEAVVNTSTGIKYCIGATDNTGNSSKTLTYTITRPNKPPVAKFTAVPTSGKSPLKVTFKDMSSDSDGKIVSCRWSFGDGQSSTDKNPIHTFTNSSNYGVTLTVTDNEGASSRSPATIISVKKE